MTVLDFPRDTIVGTVEWAGSWSDTTGPTLATGTVEAPYGAALHLTVQRVLSSEPTGGGSWQLASDLAPVDLSFIHALPNHLVESVSIRTVDEHTFDALSHLAPGLRRLTLGWSELGDRVLPTVATLTGLTSLQTFGNRFTNSGVQQLSALTNLETLYLEEETLSFGAFEFVTRLPNLKRLGLQDVPLAATELQLLRDRLPGVDVG